MTRGWKEQQPARPFGSRTACLSSNARKAGLERNRSPFPSCFMRGTRLVPLAILGIPLINCCQRLSDKCRGADFVRGEINYRLLLFFSSFFLIDVEVGSRESRSLHFEILNFRDIY